MSDIELKTSDKLKSDTSNNKLENINLINNKITPNNVEPEKQSLNQNEDTKQKRVKSILLGVFQAIVSAVLGFLFGWSMEKSKVHEPIAIRQQMIFRRFIMMKMFFAALATSTLAIFIFALIFREKYKTIFMNYKDSLKNKSFLLITSGALLVGAGMSVSGACPGMVLVQLGSGVPWSYLTLVGCLIGALLHGLLNGYIMEKSKPDLILSKAVFEVISENKVIPFVIRGLFIAVLAVAVFLMEYFIPWQSEYSDAIVSNSSNILIYKAWPPFACGMLLGSLQFFSFLLLQKSLGASSSYSTLVGIPFFTKKAQEKFPYLAKFRCGLAHWLTVIYICGAILGGFGSSYASGAFGTSSGVHPYNAIIGGALMVFGARVAGGCTSGHGISGSSHLFFGSLVAMASMFAGAIATAFYAYTNSFFF